MSTGKTSNVLVLELFEVLEDPRVWKTCRSLAADGSRVTVGCTNPCGRPPVEERDGIRIVRFPHRTDSWIKQAYTGVTGWLRPSASAGLLTAHERKAPGGVVGTLRKWALAVNFGHYLRETKRLNRLMADAFRGETFDLVHCNDWETLFAGVALKRCGAARELLYDSHEYWPGIGVTGSANNDALAAIEADHIGEADYVVTVNARIAEKMRHTYGLGSFPAVVMNCPPRTETVTAAGEVSTPVRVVYQGKIQPFRGLRELVLAFGRIDNAVLSFIGYGPLEEPLKQLVRSEGLDGRVTFQGRFAAADAVHILAGHDIGVLPFPRVTESIEYSSPNKFFDYAMAGLAVLTTDLPFLAEAVSSRDMGKVLSEPAPDALADALTAMAADRDRLAGWKANARRAAMTEYYWERQWERYPWRPRMNVPGDVP